MKDDLCENIPCKKVTERNRRHILTHSGSSIYFCSIKCLVAFYTIINVVDDQMTENKFKKLLLIYCYLRTRLSDYWKLRLTDYPSDELYYVFENVEKETIDQTLKELKEEGLLSEN